MRKLLAIVATGLLLFTAACGDDDGADTTTGAPGTTAATRTTGTTGAGHTDGGPCEPSSTEITIGAENQKFDKECIAAPADQPFNIVFENKDDGIPHNIAIFRDAKMSDRVFTGETFPGEKKTTYQLKPLDAATYHFHCDVHPDMEGKLKLA